MIRTAKSRRRHTYTKVKDARKHPIRHLNRRNGTFYARLTVEDDQGRKKLACMPLEVSIVPQAQKEVWRLFVDRVDQTFCHVGRSPTLERYYIESYLQCCSPPAKRGNGRYRTGECGGGGSIRRLHVALLEKIRRLSIQAIVQTAFKAEIALGYRGGSALSCVFAKLPSRKGG